ncbi:hypothetical protein AAVH_08351 [Aphelenchoides avenae]|nr:hypothetical protein AAVH_08351 [Aphelenchus avenae]
MATRLQRQGTDEATLVSGLAELDERMKLMDRTRGRLQEFLRFVDEKPAELRTLVDQGSTFNAILLELRGADEVKDLLDPDEDMQDKNRHRIDYEAFFGKRDVEGATWHKCKIERCNYVFGSVSQPTYVLGRRFKEHFAEKHLPRTRKEVDGEEVEELVTYEYWEDWAQLRVLEAEMENLQELLEEANQESGPPTAAKRKVIEQYEKAKEKAQTLDALIRHCPVHVHMLLQQGLPAEEVIRRLSCRLPFIQHDDHRNRPVARVITKPAAPQAQPSPAQRSTTSTPQPGPSRASATPSRSAPPPSTSSTSTNSGVADMPSVELEVRPLTSLMPIAYRQFFAVDGRGYCKCRFVDCDYTYSETGFKDADNDALKEHCLAEHLS